MEGLKGWLWKIRLEGILLVSAILIMGYILALVGVGPLHPGGLPSAAFHSGDQQVSDPADKNPQQVVWWHSMSGAGGRAVDELIARFHASRPDIRIKPVYQGSYYDSLLKWKAAQDTDAGPTMIQVYDIGSQYMIDSGRITPIQDFVDRDRLDLTQLDDRILDYYRFLGGRLYSMPFNASTPLLYYNKQRFREADLEAAHPPQSWGEVSAAAARLSGSGAAGISLPINGWLMEQYFLQQGKPILSHQNGRAGLAEQSYVNAETGIQVLSWWRKMVQDGTALSLGSSTEALRKAFVSGKTAMYLDTSASLRSLLDDTAASFELGVGPLPGPAGGSNGGALLGGASNWIMSDRSEKEQEAAWAFIRYLTGPEQQALFHLRTGYLPIHLASYEDPLVKDNAAKLPQFRTAAEQLHAGIKKDILKGPVSGVLPEARQLTEKAMEAALSGSISPQEALNEAAAAITAKLRIYRNWIRP